MTLVINRVCRSSRQYRTSYGARVHKLPTIESCITYMMTTGQRNDEKNIPVEDNLGYTNFTARRNHSQRAACGKWQLGWRWQPTRLLHELSFSRVVAGQYASQQWQAATQPYDANVVAPEVGRSTGTGLVLGRILLV
jgi:hypothetical protein